MLGMVRNNSQKSTLRAEPSSASSLCSQRIINCKYSCEYIKRKELVYWSKGERCTDGTFRVGLSMTVSLWWEVHIDLQKTSPDSRILVLME